MKTNLVLISLALLCGLLHLAQGQRDEAFEEFFRGKLLDYPKWIAENNLDPSPDLMPEMKYITASSEVSQLTYFMYNLGVAGLSSVETDIDYVTTARPMAVNTTFTTTGNLTFFGTYAVRGQVNGQSYYEDGKWSASFVDCFHGEWGVTYNHYSNGSLKVQSGFTLNTTLGDTTNVELEFTETGEGAAFQEEVKEAFASAFRWFFAVDLWGAGHPIRTYFTRYFTEVFANTTWPPEENNGVYHI